jgi:hypothetical protein
VWQFLISVSVLLKIRKAIIFQKLWQEFIKLVFHTYIVYLQYGSNWLVRLTEDLYFSRGKKELGHPTGWRLS